MVQTGRGLRQTPFFGVSRVTAKVRCTDLLFRGSGYAEERLPMAEIPKRVLTIAQGLKHGQPPRRFRVRAILKWFGASRRGKAILSEVQAILANMGLKT